MRLEDVTVEIRPRSDWEAVDAGLAMARRDFWRCWGLWLLAVLPMAGLLYMWRDHPVWWILVFFWWKIGACRMVLFQISRRLFGENPRWRQLLRELPKAWFRRFFYRMILTRLSPMKPMAMVVEELEGLRGSEYQTRVKMVLRRGEGTCYSLTLMSIFATIGVAFALLFIALMCIPDATADSTSQAMDWDDMEYPVSVYWFINSGLVLASSFVDVFFTGAGFGLYINSRTWVEGWDVELAFKRIANRLNGSLLLCLIACIGLMAQPSEAQVSGIDPDQISAPQVDEEFAQSPQEQITKIKAHEDFTVHRETYQYAKPKPSKTSSGKSSSSIRAPLELMQILGYSFFVLILIAVVVLIVWLVSRARLMRLGVISIAPPIEKARVVMGLEVTAQSLPADVLSAALELWQQGQQLQAMSLLYRGSLSWWIERAGIEIHESDTEGDCLKRVREAQHASADYFERLTDFWSKGAYAKKFPQESEWDLLCRDWPFGERRAS